MRPSPLKGTQIPSEPPVNDFRSDPLLAATARRVTCLPTPYPML